MPDTAELFPTTDREGNKLEYSLVTLVRGFLRTIVSLGSLCLTLYLVFQAASVAARSGSKWDPLALWHQATTPAEQAGVCLVTLACAAAGVFALGLLGWGAIHLLSLIRGGRVGSALKYIGMALLGLVVLDAVTGMNESWAFVDSLPADATFSVVWGAALAKGWLFAFRMGFVTVMGAIVGGALLIGLGGYLLLIVLGGLVEAGQPRRR